MKLFCSISFAFLLLAGNGITQVNNKDNKFILNVQLFGKDTGSILLVYSNSNEGHRDTAVLKNGKIKFSGIVNGANEALLFTNLKTQNVDDSSVIRFIIEPKIMSIFCNVNDMGNVRIQGSLAQLQKEKWDNEKAFLLETKEMLYRIASLLNKLKKSGEIKPLQNQIDELHNKIDFIKNEIKQKDFSYIQTNPSSYLSGYLLTKHTRRTPVDTLVKYYSLLKPKVKSSDLGKNVLYELYTLTDDWDFRENNPVNGSKLTQKVKKIKSLYDIPLLDTAGNEIQLAIFKGKYLLMDFWGSWCTPCFENIPFLKQLMEEMKSRPIQFISISLDNNSNIWKNAIRKYNFPGFHLLDKQGILRVFYKFLWVPKYIIIDPNGNVINLDAPHAKDPKLKAILNELWIEKKD